MGFYYSLLLSNVLVQLFHLEIRKLLEDNIRGKDKKLQCKQFSAFCERSIKLRKCIVFFKGNCLKIISRENVFQVISYLQ